MDVKDILKLIASIFVCQLAGMIGAVATSSSIQTWYVTLTKPFFTPPNWLFAPVWLTLYTLTPSAFSYRASSLTLFGSPPLRK